MVIKSMVVSAILCIAAVGTVVPADRLEPFFEEWEEAAWTETMEEEESEAELTMYANDREAQMLSAILQSESGATVVIDGGWEEDGDALVEAIKSKGGHVDAWLLTHPHSDHVGAFRYILENRRDEISIDKIYYSFAPLEWYEEVEPEEAGRVAGRLMEQLSGLPEDMVCDSIGKGYEINVGDLTITVLNDRYKLSSDPVNNSSIAYLAEVEGERILFLGDMGYDGGFQLLKDAGKNIKADIVQMAHHGQNGVDKKVYRAISPRVCLWPTPRWLWDNDAGQGYDSGSWRTLETRAWMKSMGVKENYCTKDGDIVLQLD